MNIRKKIKSVGLSAIIAASALTGCKQDAQTSHGLESRVETSIEKEIRKETNKICYEVQQEQQSQKENEVSMEQEQSAPLRWDHEEAKRYDNLIVHNMNKVNLILGKRFPGYQAITDIGLVRSWLVTESWNGLENVIDARDQDIKKHKTPLTPPKAWLKDPAQIANKGDYGLSALKVGGTKDAEGLLKFVPREYFTSFQNITHTPRKNGKWDYTDSLMTAENSIYGALLFLADKKHDKTITIVPSGVEEVVAQSGFNYWNQLKSRGLINQHVENPKDFVNQIFKQYNPNHRGAEKIQIGQKINLPKSGKLSVTLTPKSDLAAMCDYNGGGDPNYQVKILNKDNIRSLEF